MKKYLLCALLAAIWMTTVSVQAAPPYAVGSSGSDVVSIQSRLIDFGFLSGTADGIYGPQTENAVIVFQVKNGLNPTGIVDDATYEKLLGSSGIKASGEQPFYGIWCQAEKNIDSAVDGADELSSKGYEGLVYVTTDWSNLNSEKWYVVTAGRYYTESDANAALAKVRQIYPDAYVKWTGIYRGEASASDTTTGSVTTTGSGEVHQNFGYDLYNDPSYDPRRPFYGIWSLATKDFDEATLYASELHQMGYNGQVFNSTNYSNLNSESWYVVTAGMYYSEQEALTALKSFQYMDPEAYVKFTGDYIGIGS